MSYSFGEFHLDPKRVELRRGKELVALEPQVYEILLYLLERRDRVVSKDELLDAVWGDRYVSDSTVSHRILEVRQALGDDGHSQSLIRTVRGKGFRFVAEVGHGSLPETAPSAILGREAELERLRAMLQAAAGGQRQMAFLTGPAGMGKTTLVEALTREAGLPVALGECLDHCGRPEPFLPFLDALGRLCRGPEGSRTVEALRVHAPTWLGQLPSHVSAEELLELQRRTVGSTRERMLREMGEALEAMTRDTPLLVLEDLHWSDPSTLDLIAWTARRKGSTRLFLLGTLRPDGGGPEARMVQDCVLRGQACELALQGLQEEEAREMLVRRGVASDQAALLHRRSGGNPLFIRCLLDAWDSCQSEVPDSIRDLVERQLARLPAEERATLEAASILCSSSFSAAAVAAAAEMDEDAVEETCQKLSRRGAFLSQQGDERWPDETLCARFAFLHELLREAIQRWIPSGRRARMHARVAQRLERAWRGKNRDRSAELALHFELAGQGERAVPYLAMAAERAMQRNAPGEADKFLEAGLRHLESMPAGAERDGLELDLLRHRAEARIALCGWADALAESSYLRARELCRDDSERASVMLGLAALYEMRGEYDRCQAILENIPPGNVVAHELLACSLYHQGDFLGALQHAELGAQLYDHDKHFGLPMAAFGDTPVVSCQAWGALSLAFLGRSQQAQERMDRAVRYALVQGYRFSLPIALVHAACLHQLLDEPELCLEKAEEALLAGEQQGFPNHRAAAHILAGWALARRGKAPSGLARLNLGLQSYRSSGARVDLPYFLTLRADAHVAAGDPQAARADLTEALQFGEGRGLYVEAEILVRLGDLDTVEPQGWYRRALQAAQRQAAGLLDQRLAQRLS